MEKYVEEMKDGKWDDVSFDDGREYSHSGDVWCQAHSCQLLSADQAVLEDDQSVMNPRLWIVR